jgi:TP901 family phage tail tape measure protein
MVRRDELQLRMEIDGKQAISELGKLEMEAYEFRQELKLAKEDQAKFEKESKNLDAIKGRYEKITAQLKELEAAGKGNTKEYDRLVKRLALISEKLRAAENAQKSLTEAQKKFTEAGKNLDQTNRKINEQREKLGLTGMTMRQLRQYQRELGRQMDTDVTMGTARYEELKKKLQEVTARINQQKAEVRGTASAWSFLKSEAAKFGVLALGYLGAQEIIGRVQNLVQGSAELSDALSDVQKTTGLTKDETIELSKTLGDFNTRSARKELLEMAEIAGRLGIQGKKDIEGFVRAADMIQVSLGDSLGDVETVMRDLGKLTSTYNIQEAYGIEESLLRVGSALNELGMASTANEGNIVDFTRRMGGIAPLAKITIQDIMGMGAALDALGQTSEVSSTALSKLFVNMAKNSKEYARFAKMEVSDFVKLMNEDANEAFIRVLEGVKDNSTGITELAGTLGDLGEDGGRVIGVLGTLANKVQFLREQQDLANKSFFEYTSIFEEFQVKNENLAANLMKVQKAFNSWFISTDFMKFLESSISVLAKWVTIPISETMEKDRASMNLLYRQIIDVNTKTQDRIKLINEMKAIYPDLLGNIDAERVSNYELSTSIKRVNDQLINKIILQQQDEEIAEQNSRAAKTKKSQLESERELMLKMQKAAEKYNLEIEEGVSLVEAATKLANEIGPNLNFWELLNGSGASSEIFDEIQKLEGIISNVKAVEGETNVLLEQREDLIKRLGMAMNEEFVAGAPSLGRAGFLAKGQSGSTPPSGETAEEKAAREAAEKAAQAAREKEKEEHKKKLDQMLAEWQSYQQKVIGLRQEWAIKQLPEDEQEIEKVRRKYAVFEEELITHWQNQLLTHEQFDQKLKELQEFRDAEIAEIEKKRAEKFAADRSEAQEEIDRTLEEANLTKDQLEQKRISDHYDSLAELARKYGLDELEIIKAKDKALLDWQKAKNEEEKRELAEAIRQKAQIYAGFGEAAIGVLDAVAAFSGEANKFQKETAIFRAIIASGQAVAEIVAAFASTSFTPIDLAAKIAAGVGIIMTNIANAKRTIDSANEPEPPSGEKPNTGRSRPPVAKPKKSFYFGGPTGDGLGFGDQWGEYAGYVHRHEYVIPQAVRQEPIVRMQIEPILEALRMRAFTGRSFYSGGETSPMTTPSPSQSASGFTSDPEIKQLLRRLLASQQAAQNKKVILVSSELEDHEAEKVYLENRYRAKG